MSAVLPGVERVKLVKILGLLSSEHGGEVANAGRLADNLVRERGLRWGDVIGAPQEASAPAPAQNPFYEARRARETEWRDKATKVAKSSRATEWERAFAANILKWWAGSLTEKQQARLDEAFTKCLDD
jgi:hypothetical protein